MKLKPINTIEKQEKVTLALQGKLLADVHKYQQYFKDVFNEEIQTKDMLLQVSEYFFSSDRKFLKWKKEHSNG